MTSHAPLTAAAAPAPTEPVTAAAGVAPLARLLLRGGLALGFAVGLERGCNFFANVLAARIAGPETYGAYAIVLATAGTIATYTGAGVGATANRFAGEHPRESAEYGKLLRALVIISVGSALLAATLMLVGAAPLARLLLRNESLTGYLRVAALSAGALILLECLRGLLIGSQRFPALLLVSAVSGIGLALVLPFAAGVGAGAMIAGQAVVAVFAITACVLFAKRLGITPLAPAVKDNPRTADDFGVRRVFVFGLVQLSAVVGLNIAGWWVTSLVARADVTLVQMGVYAVANQLRQLVNIFPDLLARLCYPLLTRERGREYGGADQVAVVGTFVNTGLSIAVAAAAIIVLPFVLGNLYGEAFRAGEAACALLLATAIVHMSNAPAAQRLNIVSLRAAGTINLLWTAAMILAGTLVVPLAGAAGAGATFLISHIASAVFVLVALRRARELPKGLTGLTATPVVGALALGGLACARAVMPNHLMLFTVALVVTAVSLLCALWLFGRRRGLIPDDLHLRSVLDVRGVIARLRAGDGAKI